MLTCYFIFLKGTPITPPKAKRTSCYLCIHTPLKIIDLTALNIFQSKQSKLLWTFDNLVDLIEISIKECHLIVFPTYILEVK